MKAEQLNDSITLYEADCLDVLPTLSGVDAVVTSPPYNTLENLDAEKLTGLWGIKGASGSPKGRFVNNGYFDGIEENEYQRQQNEIFTLCANATTDTASLFYNHQCRWREGVLLHPIVWFHPQGWALRQEIIWDRGGGMMFNARMFCRFDERILWFDKGKHKWNQDATGHGTIWRIARLQKKQGKIHPVQFPVEIPARCILATTAPNETILDPFAGSGTTGIAALMEGRRAILIEKDPKYCDVIRRRVENYECQQPGSLFRDTPTLFQGVES